MKHLNDPKLKKSAKPLLTNKEVREKKTGTKTDNKPVTKKTIGKQPGDIQE